jgi:hypothetical protein
MEIYEHHNKAFKIMVESFHEPQEIIGKQFSEIRKIISVQDKRFR